MNKTPWFKEFGWIYLPKSLAGIVVTILALIFMINVFVVIDARSHSVSDTLYGIFPFWASTFLVWIWIASRTSGKNVL